MIDTPQFCFVVVDFSFFFATWRDRYKADGPEAAGCDSLKSVTSDVQD